LLELTDAILCCPGPVTSLPELSLAFVHRRGHGALYDGLACGELDIAQLRVALTQLDLPRESAGRLRLAVDVTPWPRPDAECPPQRLHCHRPCRCDGVRQTIPGWPYSMVVALESGRSSWTRRWTLSGSAPTTTSPRSPPAQIRDVFDRLRRAAQWVDGDPPVLIVTDSGYDIVRLAWLLRDLPVRLLGRVHTDWVFYAPPGLPHPHGGRPPARRPSQTVRPGQLAHPAGHRDPYQRSLRQCRGQRLRPSASAADPPRRLGPVGCQLSDRASLTP
jgi:hypothetical protein